MALHSRKLLYVYTECFKIPKYQVLNSSEREGIV